MSAIFSSVPPRGCERWSSLGGSPGSEESDLSWSEPWFGELKRNSMLLKVYSWPGALKRANRPNPLPESVGISFPFSYTDSFCPTFRRLLDGPSLFHCNPSPEFLCSSPIETSLHLRRHDEAEARCRTLPFARREVGCFHGHRRFVRGQ